MDDDTKDLLITAGAVAAGVGIGYLALQYAERRRFHENLARELRSWGLDLVNASIARDKAGKLLWNVTIAHPARGVVALVADFAQDTDAYDQKTLTQLVQRVTRYYGLAAV
jgi:hypothetical protein